MCRWFAMTVPDWEQIEDQAAARVVPVSRVRRKTRRLTAVIGR